MPALANVVAAAQQIGSNATQLSTGTSANSEVNVRLADTCGTSTSLNRW